MKEDSSLSVWKATLLTMGQLGWNPPEHELKALLWGAEAMDWAVRMYYRERVVTVLAEAGIDIYLLGEGWENHSAIGLPNVHRIADQIPYRETLTCMADARINLNVMPGFKEGTHDRIFNKESKRIILSHSRIFEDEAKGGAATETAKKPKRASKRAEETPALTTPLEKTTLGDLEALAALKEKLSDNK